MITVDLKIDNHYGNATVTTFPSASIPDPPTDVEREDWIQDHVFPLTGTGRTGDAIYEAEITASSDPSLVGKTFNWG